MTLANLSTPEVMQLALVATVGIGLTGALLAWRERPEPGSVPLTVLLAGQCWWSAMLFFQLTAAGIGDKLLWFNLSWIGVVVIPVAWLFFALEYTGYTQYIRLKYVLLTSIIPFVTVVLALTDSYQTLFYLDATLVESGQSATLVREPGIWFWIIASYTYAMGLLGAIPMLQFVTSEVNSFRGQSLAILIGLFVPWVTNALHLMGVLPTAGIDPTPIAFSISGVAYLGALTQFELFGTSPAPIRPARRSVFERMQQGVIVLDRQDHVVDVNTEALETLGQSVEDVLGRPLGDAVPQLESVLEDRAETGQRILHPEGDSGAYDVSVSRLTDIHGRDTGRIVTLHDITEHVRQQQRLEVLNRVFRHNIRTNTQVIVGNAEYLADHNSEAKAAKVREKALEVEEIGDEIRTVLDVFEEGRKPATPVLIEHILENCIETIRDEYPGVDVNCDCNAGDVYVDSLLDDVFENLVENAAQHNTSQNPTIWIDVEAEGEHVHVAIEDNGPGIEDEELALVEQGTETPLEHGTGFGLALATWGTEMAGGRVQFEESDPTGLRVSLDVPRLSRSADESDRTGSTDLPVQDADDVVRSPHGRSTEL